MRTLLSIALLSALALPSYALAQKEEATLPVDQRIKMLMYDPTDVYTITTKYGYQTNIVFDKNESIETISVGDRSLWQIIPSGNRIFIRPMEDGITTNMTVLTSKHSYQFDLKSTTPDQEGGNIYVAQFMYVDVAKPEPARPAAVEWTPPTQAAPPSLPPMPAPPAAVSPAPEKDEVTQKNPAPVVYAYQPPVNEPEPAMKAPAPESKPAKPVVLKEAPRASSNDSPPPGSNYSYTYAGPDAAAPLQVYDDGRFTYIKYLRQPLPDLYIVGAGNKETRVSYEVQGDFLVVDGISSEMLLKHKDGTVRIYNETLNPG